MKKLFVFCTAAALTLSAFAGDTCNMVPMPKKAESKGKAYFAAPSYRIADRMKTPAKRLEVLKEELAGQCRWQEKKDGAILIELLPLASKEKNEEYYTLSIAKDRITLSAATGQGMALAMGRLLNIISGDDKVIDGKGGVTLPTVNIADFPDMKVRAAKLEMCYKPRYGVKAWHDTLKRQIRTLANLGYNCVIMEIGGRFQSRRNPEISLQPAYTKQEIEALTEYARACGLTPYPAINSIGHMERAPQVFPVKNAKGKVFAMDLNHKDFYPVYLGYTDEISQAFGNPEYFFIGTDEFGYSWGLAELEKIIGMKVQQFYPEFINRVYNHLSKKGVTPVVYHDMLAPRKERTELFSDAANGPDDAIENILCKLNRKVSVAYWNYGPGDYSFVNTMQKNGFNDIWAVGWFNPEGLRRLTAASIKKNLKFAASVWWIHPHGGGYATAADIAWNALNPPKRSNLFYNDTADSFFYRRTAPLCYNNMKLQSISGGEALPAAQSAGIKAFFDKIPGLAFDAKNVRVFAVNPPEEVPLPWDFAKLDLKRVLFQFGNVPEYLAWDKIFLNKSRNTKELVIYTPEFGKTTRTNQFGSEITVTGGKISAMTGTMDIKRKGDSPIPADGAVLSLHGPFLNSRHNDRSSHDLLSGLEIGQKVTLRLRPEAKGAVQTVKCSVKGGKNTRVAVWLMPLFPIDRNLKLCTVKLKKQDGKTARYTLNGINTIRANSTREGDFLRYQPLPFERRALGVPPVIAVEWQGKGAPEELVITSEEGGILSGLAVLGVWTFQEK